MGPLTALIWYQRPTSPTIIAVYWIVTQYAPVHVCITVSGTLLSAIRILCRLEQAWNKKHVMEDI